MDIKIYQTKEEMARTAAVEAATIIRQTVRERGRAHLIAATGASQFEFLDHLVRTPEMPWDRTIFFHLDEYVGLSASHPASFRRYLRERIDEKVHPGEFHFINGENPDPHAECQRVGELILRHPIDLAFVGIGENGHLAFNDPPADFETKEPYLVVNLDEACRLQQVGEGWFAHPDDVPRQAISMSVQQILQSKTILCIVPDRRKARAVAECVEQEVSPMHPASILQRHPRTTLYLDADAATLLAPATDGPHE